MKLRNFLLMTAVCSSIAASAYDVVWLHNTPASRLGVRPNMVKSVMLSDEGSAVNVSLTSGSEVQIPYSDFSHVSFGQSAGTIDINFGSTTELYANPLAFEGVEVQASGDKITVNNNSINPLNINVSGKSDAAQL